MNEFKEAYTLVLNEIQAVFDNIDSKQVQALVDSIISAEKVFLVGVGRVMLCLKAFSKRLNHLGIKAYCVGDENEPAITNRDLLIVGSGSGESVIPVAIAKVATQFKPQIAHIGSNYKSSIEPITDLFIRIPAMTKLKLPGEFKSKQPMTNIFDQSLYILCDVITILIIKEKGLDDIESLWQFHANLE
jgi:6-phospho-3-hexuloisomerase